MAPGDVRSLHQVVSTRANDLSIIGCDPRTQDSKLTVGSALCKLTRIVDVIWGVTASFSTRQKETITREAGKAIARWKSKKRGVSIKCSSDAKGTPNARKGLVRNRRKLWIRHIGQRCAPEHLQR